MGRNSRMDAAASTFSGQITSAHDRIDNLEFRLTRRDDDVTKLETRVDAMDEAKPRASDVLDRSRFPRLVTMHPIEFVDGEHVEVLFYQRYGEIYTRLNRRCGKDDATCEEFRVIEQR